MKTTTLEQSRKLKQWGFPQVGWDGHPLRDGQIARPTAEELREWVLGKMQHWWAYHVTKESESDYYYIDLELRPPHYGYPRMKTAKGFSELDAWFQIAEQVCGGE